MGWDGMRDSMWIGWEHGMEREGDRHCMGMTSLLRASRREEQLPSHPRPSQSQDQEVPRRRESQDRGRDQALAS